MKLYNIRGRTCFSVYSETDGSCGKFINALRNSPVQFFGLAVRGGRLYGYVPTRSYGQLEALAKEHKLVCEEISRSGALRLTDGYRRRYGLIAGFLLSLGLIAFLNDRVMVIEIGGNETIPESRVLSHLKDAGIYPGSSISSVDLRLAERRIAAMDKDIDWVGIKHIGSRVTVEINEITHPPEMKRKNTPCNIVAARDAQITGVKIYSGMLIPMVGDGVKKGDVIVSGVVDTKYGRSYYVRSIGEITGIYTEKMTFSQSLRGEELVCTGERTSKALDIFGRRFIYSPADIPEGEHEYSETQKRLTFLGLSLPLCLTEIRCRVMEPRPVTLTEKQAEALIKERMERYESNFLGGAELLDRHIAKTSENNVLTFTVTYTLRGEIGREKMIFARYELPDDDYE